MSLYQTYDRAVGSLKSLVTDPWTPKMTALMTPTPARGEAIPLYSPLGCGFKRKLLVKLPRK